MLAKSTAAARKSKRAGILEIAEAVTGLPSPFPLDAGQLWEIAGTVAETGMRAGGQYVTELKAMQLELGFEWPDWLEKQLVGCKRALGRDLGPETRAIEVKPDDIPVENLLMAGSVRSGPKHPVLAYAWACVWMLRSGEAVQVRVGEVRIKAAEKLVVLTIPRSKTDQRAKSTFRTLGCCRRTSCDATCPFLVATVALASVQSQDKDGPLFRSKTGGRPSRFGLVKAWMGWLSEEMSGHSARRSGAMWYARQGLPTHEIGFLGRWKSSAVFRYVEEALQALPLNERAELRRGPGVGPPHGHDGRIVEERAEPEPAVQPEVHHPKVVEVPDETMAEQPETKRLWAVSVSRAGRVFHLVRRASWNLRIEDWSTACGWAFASRNCRVELTKTNPFASKVCQKCANSNCMRDEVSGGKKVAHVVQVEI